MVSYLGFSSVKAGRGAATFLLQSGTGSAQARGPRQSAGAAEIMEKAGHAPVLARAPPLRAYEEFAR